jgi:hypothetical protein
MKRFLGRLATWAALPLLLILAQSLITSLWHAARLHGFGFASLFQAPALAFACGIALRMLAGAALRRFGRDDPFEFIDTLEHELTHALVGYLTLTPPVSLSATLKTGGEVELKGSNPLAALAPYYLPLWCQVAVLIGLIARSGLQSGWTVLVFFLLGNFCVRLAKEYRWRQTDLHIYGFLFSTAAVLVLLLLNLALVLNARGVVSWGWVGDGLRRSGHGAAALLSRLQGA